MIPVDPDLLRKLVAEARLAPSVHNIQPSRVSLDGGAILFHADPSRTLPAADPTGHDVRLSHGAFIEGLSIALGENGLRIAEIETSPVGAPGPFASITVASGGERDAVQPQTATRASWRGGFRPADEQTRASLERLMQDQPDLLLVADRPQVARIATLADEAGIHFTRESDHRRELLHWMRLSRSHPGYHRDGLNADAMALGSLEAWAAGLVLGPLFAPLDAVGLAKMLTSEAGKARSAAAMAIFHRPKGEDPLLTGRAFYRAWLSMEKHGLAGCPISVLADWPQTNEALRSLHKLPADRRLVNVFRLGVPKGDRRIEHARLPVDEYLRLPS